MSRDENIYVTKPFLPPFEEYTDLLKSVWETNILTNSGPLEQQLSQELKAYLGVKNLTLTSSATTGLVIAFLALRLQKKVLTTPFTFPATLHALSIVGLKPVFADVDISSGLLTKETIEAGFEHGVEAVLATNAFGQPINVSDWADFKLRSNCKLIFDAAPAFGTVFRDGKNYQDADATVISFHATKTYNTFEGGVIISSDSNIQKRINLIKNFGFDGPENVLEVGMNGKMSEAHAAMGIVNLRYIDECIAKRKLVFENYRERLSFCSNVELMNIFDHQQPNFAYLPIKCSLGEHHRDLILQALERQNIFARKYYYPLLSNTVHYKNCSSACPSNLPNANILSKTVLCLPIYPDLDGSKIKQICDIIRST
ncbi:DegT/DnrJ/EryC1/StrS family aminotransferase [Alphaproteobacteria bacterium LSUCC0744]